MTHIPIEVLNEIFINLDLKDKLECMLVCRLWYNTLDQYGIFQTLAISNRVFFKLKAMIERQPHRAKQVQSLTLNPTPRYGFDKRIVCNMFPNLRQVIFLPDTYQRTNNLDNPFHFTHSASKLEMIKDFGECELTRQLDMANRCGNLKTLALDFLDFDNITHSRFLRELKNMPILEELRLFNLSFKLMDLETMHSNLPSIKNLHIDDAVIAPGDSPLNVIPASVINFDMFLIEADDLHPHIELYNYAAKKYSSAINPLLVDIALIYHDTEYARHVYEEGIFPFYQMVGPRVECISLLHYCNGLNAFEKFDNFGMKLKTLSLDLSREGEAEGEDEDVFFMEELVQSKQAKYIQRLSLKDLVPTPMKKMLNLEVLTDLRVACNYDYEEPCRFTRKTIDFNQLIAACPTKLTNLQVEGFRLTFNETTSNRTCVETLCLKGIDLTPDLATVIETSFPKLSTLELRNAFMDDVSIRLPENNFKLIKIETFYKKERQNGFSIKTTSDNKVRCYSLNHRTNSVVLVPKEEFDNPLVLNVTCASVAKLSLSINY